jgi:hypothetical protein
MLPNDPGPGANATPPNPEFPAPLDFTIRQPGVSFLARFGPGFEWMSHEGKMKLVVSFSIAGGPVLHRILEPEESALLLEWLLRAAEVRDGG